MPGWSQQRQRLLAEKKAEIAALADLSVTEVTPSRRDFTQFIATQKTEIALVARLKRADPVTGSAWRDLDLVRMARACDETEVGAIAVATAECCGGTVDDLRTVASAVTAPVLRDDLCLHARQIYQSRLFGADAVVLPAAHVPAAELPSLLGVADSLHVTAVLEVCDEATLAVSLRHAPACIGLYCPAADGFTNLARARFLAERIPRQRSVLLLSEVREIESVRVLRGFIDAAVVGNALLDAADPAVAIEAFLGGA